MAINKGNLRGLNGLLIFEIGKKECCIDIQIVSEIIKIKDVNIKINNSNEAIVESGEEEFKVIKLHQLIGFPEINANNGGRIILVDSFSKKIAFLVDKVVEIITTDKIFVENSLDLKLLFNKKYLSGLLKYQEREMLIPDFEIISKELDKLAKISTVSQVFGEPFHHTDEQRQRRH